jgi:hypothetical protein
MNQGKKGQSQRSTGKKKPYRSPELTVHGGIRALTAKSGLKADGGGGVPRTKL